MFSKRYFYYIYNENDIANLIRILSDAVTSSQYTHVMQEYAIAYKQEAYHIQNYNVIWEDFLKDIARLIEKII